MKTPSPKLRWLEKNEKKKMAFALRLQEDTLASSSIFDGIYPTDLNGGNSKQRRLPGVVGFPVPLHNQDLGSPKITDMAALALLDHNRRTGEKMVLEEIVKGEVTTVAGAIYRLILKVSEGGHTHIKYVVAQIFSCQWKNLFEFFPLKHVEDTPVFYSKEKKEAAWNKFLRSLKWEVPLKLEKDPSIIMEQLSLT